VAGPESVATVDPVSREANYRSVEEVPLSDYDSAMVCTPDDAKIEILRYLVGNGKHVLVEKPLIPDESRDLEEIVTLTARHGVTCYTAYNHRFEPHFIEMKKLLESGELGRIYHCRMFYGNGTARDVRNSPWRDKGMGVLGDLGSHLLDTTLYWLQDTNREFHLVSCHRFENSAFDHFVFGSEGEPTLEMEVSLLSWRNRFTCDLIGERGSAHIDSLCKWGPTTFIRRWRKLPSGRPDERAVTIVQPDPTWSAEYDHFKKLCRTGASNLENDLWINRQLKRLAAASFAEVRA
jgi:predicted dehydrogenase